MHKLSELIKKLAVAMQRNKVASHPAVDLSMEANADKLEDKLPQIMQKLTGVNICLLVIALYFYGVLIGSVKNGIALTFKGGNTPLFDWNPFTSILTAISPFGIIFAIGAIAFCFLFSEKFRDFLAGEKNQKDARGFTVLSTGTHGTSGFMNEDEKALALNMGATEQTQDTLLGKLNTNTENKIYATVKSEMFLNGHILVFGASGAGKTTGFTIPFVLQKIRSKQSIIVVDPKGDLYEKTATFAPFVNTSGRYSTSRASTQRPLMLPDEIMRMENNRSIVLLRGQKPLQLYKIIPTELPDYQLLQPCKISDYTPHWRTCENETNVKTIDVKEVTTLDLEIPQQMSLQDEPPQPKQKVIYQYELVPEQEPIQKPFQEQSNTAQQPEMLGNLRRYSGAGKAVTIDDISNSKS